MRKYFKCIAAAGLGIMSMQALAADHLDGPYVATDPAADINDVFAWMSSDAQTLNLVMSVFPGAANGARFSDAVRYRFHTSSQSAYGATDSRDVTIECDFNLEQVIHCNANGTTVSGKASDPQGIQSNNGQLRVFAGLRNDPFFFNGSGFRATAEIVTGAASSLSFDADGCPALDAGTSNALVTQLRSEPDGSVAQDDFAGQNILAIVLAVDKSLINSAGDIVSVYGSTVRK